ncbi:M20 family metallopeptidase [Tomitella gaofuii]|uniref:M20 family metallopeptidase n=1 Tax=Tomitella gaofuii TaxID=2760083 RepID=UPI0015FCA406|nr:M20 family metallopeptidase [Tomitella gaofuii]
MAAGADWFEEWLGAHRDDLTAWRRHIHRNPELSRKEFQTTDFVVEHLRASRLDPQVLPGGTGLVCDIGPADADGKRIALRADMDALPMTETTGLPFASRNPGAAHACGHDAHTAILLGTGLALASAPQLQQGVRLLFQPAEEVMPGGALDAIAAGALGGVSRIFGLHCDPHLRVGTVGLRVGAITSAADIVEVRLSSPGGHTSRPHLTADLVHAIGLLITGIPNLVGRRVDARSRTVVTWGAVNAGAAPNAIPRSGVLRGTVRTGDRATWRQLRPLVCELIQALAVPTGVEVEIDYRQGVPPVVNDEHSVAVLRRAVDAIGPDVAVPTPQSSGGEDFAWYLEKVPGAMARLGVWDGGRKVDIHQPDFDLDERALEVGVRTMVNLVAPRAKVPYQETLG